MNQFNLIGRCTKDFECRYTTGQNPTAVAEFNLAVNRNKDEADFPRVTVFGKTAENCEKYIGKGSQVAVTGHIQTGSYEGKDGNTVYYTRLVADRVDAGDWARTNLIFGVYGSMLLIPIGNFMKKEGETRDERRTGENTAMWGYGITITSRLINTIVIAAKASKNIKASKKNQLSFVPIQTMDNKYALGTSYSIDF